MPVGLHTLQRPWRLVEHFIKIIWFVLDEFGLEYILTLSSLIASISSGRSLECSSARVLQHMMLKFRIQWIHIADRKGSRDNHLATCQTVVEIANSNQFSLLWRTMNSNRGHWLHSNEIPVRLVTASLSKTAVYQFSSTDRFRCADQPQQRSHLAVSSSPKYSFDK